MQEANMALADLQRRLMEKRASDEGQRESLSRGAGFALAHRVVRDAAQESGITLPPISDDLVKDYEAYIADQPDVLKEGFRRDYAIHKAVVHLVEDTLTNPHSQEGARMLFTFYGRLANPDRGPIAIPLRKVTQQRQRLPKYQRHLIPQHNGGKWK